MGEGQKEKVPANGYLSSSDVEMLKSAYYDPKSPAGFGTWKRLYNEVKKKEKSMTKAKVLEFLHSQRVHNLYYPRRKKFVRRMVSPGKPKEIAIMDLVVLEDLSFWNSSYKYIVTCIQGFSRYAFCRCIKKKNKEQVKEAIDSIFEEMVQLPTLTESDRGSEFFPYDLNSQVKTLLYFTRIVLLKLQRSSDGTVL